MNRITINASILAALFFTAGSHAANVTAEKLYNQYKGKNDNKAYAIGTNGVAGAAWGATTKDEAMALAIQTCAKFGGSNCNVTEVNGLPLTHHEPPVKEVSEVKNYRTVNNYTIVSNGVNYKPDTSFIRSGFFVNNEYILTTSDVIDHCTKVSFERNGRLVDATIIRVDKMNKLSILKSSVPNDSHALISTKKKTLQGERTYTYGFVFSDDLSDMANTKVPSYQGKITDGIISRASGKSNDVRYMSVTNEINAGNVGGPVLAENGEVIGLVGNLKKATIKASMLSIFLNEQNISYHVSKDKGNVSPSVIAEKSKQFTVPLVCFNES